MNTIIPVSEKSQAAFIRYANNIQHTQKGFQDKLRESFTEIDKQYQREVDKTEEQRQAETANRRGDSTKFQHVVIPIVQPQVETAVTFLASVFLSDSPIFSVVTSPQFADEALQLETIIDNHAVHGGWARELLLFFRDGLKYNFAPIEVVWTQEIQAGVNTDLSANLDEGIPKQVTWSGNKIRRLDPYNTFVDPRVVPTQVYKNGDYAGYTELMTRMQLATFLKVLPNTIKVNVEEAFESNASGISQYYTPTVNADLVNTTAATGEFDWSVFAGLESVHKKLINYKNIYEVTTIYCRIIPAEFGLSSERETVPHVYKVIIVNSSIIVHFERQTNAHNWIPILVGQPNEDGLNYQTKSLAVNTVPFQQVVTSYMNSIIASRRRAVAGRVAYDPKRVSSRHINSSDPSARFPVRTSAFSANVSDAIYQFPYNEDQASINMAQIAMLLGVVDKLTGQNPALQGHFVKGNKTAGEFNTIMQNASGRDRMTAILLETQLFSPLKQILKYNILQYQTNSTLLSRDKQIHADIDPIKLRKAVLEFKLSDGIAPADKALGVDTLAVALQVLGSSPQLAAEYNLGQLFSYLMKAEGARISEFEKSSEQLAYEQALASWTGIVELAIRQKADLNTLPPQPLPKDYGIVEESQKEDKPSEIQSIIQDAANS